MYEPLLLIHSWLRWVVLLGALFYAVKSYRGWRRNLPWTAQDGHFFWAFDQAFGYQVLFGLTLWLGMSPFVKAFFKEPGLAFENSLVFFWAIRHPASMLVAIVVFNVLKDRALKQKGPERWKWIFISLVVTLLIIVSAVPWPGMEAARPLLRGLL